MEARPPRRHRDRARAQPAAQAVAQAGHDDRRLRRRQVLHEGQRQARRDAAAGRLRGVASTDIIFAVDSIPAIFAVTQESFIVFAANAFALIGLRALYFLLVGLMDRFVYLTQGLSFILAFIGVKMMLIDIWHVPIWLSLAVIAGTLA